MPINFEDYISTSLRWAMFKADWPDATVDFTEATAEEAGIPSSFHKKDEKVCIATVTRYTGDKQVLVGYKTLSDAKGRDTDSWNVLCSKAMGRALKKAGYPDNMNDLKVLMRFRESIGTAKKVETTKPAAPAVETKQMIAGNEVTQPAIKVESKEQPVKPILDWSSEMERDSAHTLFKQTCSDLTPDELETLRDAHDKLNNRQWPMARVELNSLIVTLEGIRALRSMIAEKVDVSVVKSMYEFSSPHIQEIVKKELGDPETWPAEFSEEQYDKIVEVFEAASEAE